MTALERRFGNVVVALCLCLDSTSPWLIRQIDYRRTVDNTKLLDVVLPHILGREPLTLLAQPPLSSAWAYPYANDAAGEIRAVSIAYVVRYSSRYS